MALASVTVVGITDAGPDSLLPQARAVVDQAAVLCGGERQLAFFPEHPGERIVLKADAEHVIELLKAETRPVVVLASGDPDCYGIGPLVVDRLGRERVEIIPNVGSVQLAFARLGVAWQDAAILSAHGRPLEAILPAALLTQKAAILTDGHNTPSAVARALLDAGSEDARVDVFEHLGGPAERHVAGRLSDLVDQSFAALNVLVVRRDEPPRPWPLGLPEEAFAHRGGLITKSEVRVVALAKLYLHERAVVWDVGAGCGSVAIEAGALARHGRVYAVERDPEQAELLAENRRRFAAGNVEIVAGEAPAALASLPQPDAVFVGGSGGRLRELLGHCLERLRPGGRLVANLATIEHLGEAIGLAQERGWPTEVVQVGISRGSPIGELTRLEALNPVFVVTMHRGASPTAVGEGR